MIKLIIKKVSELKPDPNNPRKYTDKKKLANMATTVQHHSVIQPTIIDENNQIIIGELRWKAAKIAGLNEIPCLQIENLDNLSKLEKQLIENFHHQKFDVSDHIEDIKLLLANELTSCAGCNHDHPEPDLNDKCKYSRATRALANKLGIDDGWLRDNIQYSEKASSETKAEGNRTDKSKKMGNQPRVPKTTLVWISTLSEDIQPLILKKAKLGWKRDKLRTYAQALENRRELEETKKKKKQEETENISEEELEKRKKDEQKKKAEEFVKKFENTLDEIANLSAAYRGVEMFKTLQFAAVLISKTDRNSLKRRIEIVLDCLDNWLKAIENANKLD